MSHDDPLHVVLAADATDNVLLRHIHGELDERFGVGHSTIQFEAAGPADCPERECRPSKRIVPTESGHH
jgi:hypothetical protein